MISLIEALNYRCLRYVKQRLGPFHVLVGPNASGKTTFLDVVAFLGDLVSDGLQAAVEARSPNLGDLVWGREGTGFEVAIEASIPEHLCVQIAMPAYDTVRYEAAVGVEEGTGEIAILGEQVLLKCESSENEQIGLFPVARPAPERIMTRSQLHGTKTLVKKNPQGNDNFYPEVRAEKEKRWTFSYKLGSRKSALGNLPEDESKFPVSTWLKTFLSGGVQKLLLNSLVLRKASPPGQGKGFRPDGSNLPWVINELEKKRQEALQNWVEHLKTALPDLEIVRTVERPDDKHRYLVLRYANGIEVPSWMASDGTLRLLALTLPAYLPVLKGAYLIEEPENGIHPRAVESMFQSLSSVYGAQILMATHSPVILSLVEAANVLCFAKTEEGATDIVSGDRHPALREWRGETTLGTLFAAGVLG